jgi:hypothetical protein
MKKELLEILVCPVCHGKLLYHKQNNELFCKFDRLVYPIDDGIPVLLEDKARQLNLEDVDNYLQGA